MQAEQLLKIVQEVLEDRKGHAITVLDVRNKTSFTDYMVVVTGTSDRHLQAMGFYLGSKVKELGMMPIGIEGGPGSDWVLVDLGDVIIHAMTKQARDHYQLEKLWSVELPDESAKKADEENLEDDVIDDD